MVVLIADKFEPLGIDALREMGCKVVYEPGRQGPELLALVERSRCEVFVVRSTKVTRDILAAGERLALVVRAGAGVDNVDVAAASERGVLVANCPGMNSVAVAELTFALILSLDRRVPDCVAELRAGRWNKAEYSQARGLKGRTLGIVGLGPIGRAVAQRAAVFEMNVLGWSRSLASGGGTPGHVAPCPTLLELARRSDVVSIHVASTPQTVGLIDRSFFEAMRPDAYFINTSRGSIVDAAALAWAVRKKKIRAGLDVYAAEPATATADFRDPLFEAGGMVYGTPHIAASTEQAQAAIAAETVRVVRVYRETGRVENCVNLSPRSAATRMVVVRHYNRPGVLAHVLSLLGEAAINVEEMENVILADQQTAVARIRLASSPAPELLERIHRGSPQVIALSLVELPG